MFVIFFFVVVVDVEMIVLVFKMDIIIINVAVIYL